MVKLLVTIVTFLSLLMFFRANKIISDKDTIVLKEQVISQKQGSIDSLFAENSSLKNKILSIMDNGIKVTVTNYNPVRNQTDSTPNITADLTTFDTQSASRYKYAAVSRNLLKHNGGMLEFGDLIILKNAGGKDGIYIVRDTMNERYVNYIDILETLGTENYSYHNVDLYKLDWVQYYDTTS